MAGISFEQPGLNNTTHDGKAIVSSKRLGFMLYIGLTIMLFAGLFAGWFVLRGSNEVWPPLGTPEITPIHVLPTILCILVSTIFMSIAASYSRRGNYNLFRQWVIYSLLASILFLIAFVIEWYRLVSNGLGMDAIFGSIYYIITGLFIVHHIGGIVAQIKFVRKGAAVSMILEKNTGFANSVSWHYLMLVLWIVIAYLVYVSV